MITSCYGLAVTRFVRHLLVGFCERWSLVGWGRTVLRSFGCAARFFRNVLLDWLALFRWLALDFAAQGFSPCDERVKFDHSKR